MADQINLIDCSNLLPYFTLCMQAIALSEYLESTNGTAVAGKRVLELGAGTGLVGMVASALGT